MSEYQPRYSGPNRTGICKCGHSWDDHHLGVVMNREYGDATGEAYVPGECEFFGCNELGGLMPSNEIPENDMGPLDHWTDHCHGYRDEKE